MTALQPPPAPPAPQAASNDDPMVVLDNIPWQSYVAIGNALEDRHVHLTYDRGTLYIMTLSPLHEQRKKWISRLLEAMAIELRMPLSAFGSTTYRSKDLERGLEPDECYYIRNESLIRGKSDLDLSRDPPPDLAIEIEGSRSTTARMRIYAALGVPELWRYDGSELRIYLLQQDRTYAVGQESLNFPGLPLDEFASFLVKSGAVDDTKRIVEFMVWVREHVAPIWGTGANG